MEKSFLSQSHKNSIETDFIFDDSNKKYPKDNKATFQQLDTSAILMIITIDLGNEKKDNIEIKINDDPEELAYRFITKNNLDFKILGVLTENIKKNMGNLINEKNLSNKYESIKEESPLYIIF